MKRENLRVDRLMAAASELTALSDFGDASYRDFLDLLVWSLRRESDLNPRGHRAATDMLVVKLAVRLQVIDAHKRFPEIGEQAVESPIFIVGMPRTGSTLTHHLFGQDHRLRVPRRWELCHPWPPPEPSTYFQDPRISWTNAEMAPIYEARPRLAAMHPMRGDFPEECVHILTSTFASTLYWVLFGAPHYQATLTDAEMVDAYRFHKMFLQLLQWRYPASPWVLKYPGHIGHLDALSQVYPDARFIWLHRDPVESITSATHLCAIANRANRWQCDSASIAGRITRDYAERCNVSMDERSYLETPESPWLDVTYEDLLEDPVSCMSRMYGWAGLALDSNTAAAMQRYVDHPPYPRGGYTNDASSLGVDVDSIQREFADYSRRYIASD